ncbi:MAG: methionyl-tRNA formyltransferase [Chloroflexi bacterium]|nr:methionyl-tRNA formyltransferase [Chloroflexota bacterium]
MEHRERIVFMGTPRFAVPVLEGLQQAGYDIVGVVTQPDKPVGRKGTPTPPPVKLVALQYGLRVFQPQRLRDVNLLEELRSLQPDVIVVAAFGKILPREVLALPTLGCLNVHASLLPKYRGAAPISEAILDGEKETGITIMLMDEGMDSGPILAQVAVEIYSTDTAESLGAKLAEAGARLLLEVLPEWTQGKITPRPQDPSQATYVKMLAKEDGLIDWTTPAEYIERQVRAFYPWPTAYTFWDGKQLKILRAAVRLDSGGAAPGRVSVMSVGVASGRAGREEGELMVACGRGQLALLEVQLAGKKAMGADEFLRGHRRIVGAVLGRPSPQSKVSSDDASAPHS